MKTSRDRQERNLKSGRAMVLCMLSSRKNMEIRGRMGEEPQLIFGQ